MGFQIQVYTEYSVTDPIHMRFPYITSLMACYDALTTILRYTFWLSPYTSGMGTNRTYTGPAILWLNDMNCDLMTRSNPLLLRIFAIILLLLIGGSDSFNHTFKYHVFAPMGRFQLELNYLYFPPSSHLLYVCFCPTAHARRQKWLQHPQDLLIMLL